MKATLSIFESDKTNLNWFTYPYIFIFINVAGKIPEKEIFDAITKHWDTVSEMAKGSANSVFKGGSYPIEINRPTYDKLEHILWYRSETDIRKSGSPSKVKSIHGTYHTEFGGVDISCHTLGKVKGITEKCLSIISSVNINEKYKYRSSSQ